MKKASKYIQKLWKYNLRVKDHKNNGETIAYLPLDDLTESIEDWK